MFFFFFLIGILDGSKTKLIVNNSWDLDIVTDQWQSEFSDTAELSKLSSNISVKSIILTVFKKSVSTDR